MAGLATSPAATSPSASRATNDASLALPNHNETPMSQKPIELASAQARIDAIQKLYREWTQLLPKLQAAQQDWQRGIEIMRELSHFYFEGEYMPYYEAIENGLAVNLHTEGEYSVMSQDALWDAFHEQHALAWQRLRSAIDVLDSQAQQDSPTASPQAQ